MVAAIADGLDSPALKAKLTEAEEEKTTIEAQLQRGEIITGNRNPASGCGPVSGIGGRPAQPD